VGIKCVHDNVESTAIVDAALDRVNIAYPDFDMPPGGLNIRPSDNRFDQERRLHVHKRFAAVAFARANRLDSIVLSGGKSPRIGVVSTGKSYLDTRQALDELGIDEVEAARLGLRLLKVAMVWPLDPQIVREFAKGLDLVIVVEEKRALIETQIRDLLCNEKAAPRVIGKTDEAGEHLFPAYGTLEPNRIALALGQRLLKDKKAPQVAERLEAVRAMMASLSNAPDLVTRTPYFCAGCPHNSSTVVPEGGRGYAGIGCHWMVQAIPERLTEGATHMGGEGANWIGEAPFSKRKHVFQNLGDGTYNHSGVMALRAAAASGVNMTFKILYNDAVAMTGGQPHEGGLTVPMIANQVRSEGIERIAVVSDEPDKYPPNAGFPPNVTFHHRDDLQAVQTEMMDVDGVSVIIYDQTCAAEKRRRRKRGTFPDPAKRVFINELVCEGCGDCGVQSNCVAIAPLETPFGRKRQIDQSACNKDFSCLKGFCPSFVTVEGAEVKRGVEAPALPGAGAVFPALPEPEQPALDRPWTMLITGIGGTGVVTVGQILGMAAHLEGKGAGIIDMAGLSQKNGAVVTHLKIAARPDDIASIRVAAGGADCLLGCDIVTSASEHNLEAASRERTYAVVNDHEAMPAAFTQNADFRLPTEEMRLKIAARTRPEAAEFINASKLATALLGDSIAANLFTTGYAWQRGLIPLSADAICRAIELNGVAVKMNTEAFLWGRRAAHDRHAVEAVLGGAEPRGRAPETLDEIVARRVEFLTGYQNQAYAEDYRQVVDKVRAAEAARVKGSTALSEAVARYLFKLMAYKDEYEVARLFTDGRFNEALDKTFKGDAKLTFHLAPPIMARLDPVTGVPRKRTFGPWIIPVFKLLASLKGLRGTPFDIFGRSAERRRERQLIADYRRTVDELIASLTPDNHALAVEIASLPEHIRGFGHVKQRHLEEVSAREAELREAWRSGATRAPQQVAAE
ncbi:MAG: indolepyruvate ferredoxin oxidoreductase family protein, partial [Hyphomicrobiales bacterium]